MVADEASLANDANDVTEANETDEAINKEASDANCSIETIDECLSEYYSSIESSEWYIGICIDRSGRNNQLGSGHICFDRRGHNNQLGSSRNNELVVVNTDLHDETVEVDKANRLDETDEANVADRTNLANEANEASLASEAHLTEEAD
jgi:hypothetical protein